MKTTTVLLALFAAFVANGFCSEIKIDEADSDNSSKKEAEHDLSGQQKSTRSFAYSLRLASEGVVQKPFIKARSLGEHEQRMNELRGILRQAQARKEHGKVEKASETVSTEQK